ncbi:type II toxin-antitoxin system HicB family antitoxin [bacterium]|nr:type II toxin-antitoxin system HicB family antitoxin [bacterium]
MKYPVVMHKSEYGYDVHCPILPGCHSQGDTIDDALENIRDAIITYLGVVAEERLGSIYEVEVAV